MRKLFLFFTCFIISFSLFGQDKNLDTAIIEAANYFNERLPRRTRIAVTNIGAESYGSRAGNISEYIIDGIIKNFVDRGNFSIVERQHIDRARNEIRFNMSEEVSDQTAQRIGNFLGAEVVIFGSIKPMGNVVIFQVRAIRVSTAEIIGIYRVNIQENDINRIFGRQEKQSGPPLVIKPLHRFGFELAGGVETGFGIPVLCLQSGVFIGNFSIFFETSGGLYLMSFGGGDIAPGAFSAILGGAIDYKFINTFILGIGGGIGGSIGVMGSIYYPYVKGAFSIIEEDFFKFEIFYKHFFFEHGSRFGVKFLFGS